MYRDLIILDILKDFVIISETIPVRNNIFFNITDMNFVKYNFVQSYKVNSKMQSTYKYWLLFTIHYYRKIHVHFLGKCTFIKNDETIETNDKLIYCQFTCITRMCVFASGCIHEPPICKYLLLFFCVWKLWM